MTADRMTRIAIALAVVAALLTGCSSGKGIKPRPTSCEPGCSERRAAPLSDEEARGWMQKARDEVQAQADRGEITLSKPLASIKNPTIEWYPCPFWATGYDTPGGPVSNGCTVGLTSVTNGVIRISTWERERTGPLVHHEMRNWLWMKTGNERLTY